MGRLGRRLGLCPYYGSRALVSEADVVALPYSALLSAETRGSLGLHLEGSVVIFDEAHNLVDAVLGAHGAQVSGPQLATAHRWVAPPWCSAGGRLGTTWAFGDHLDGQPWVRVCMPAAACIELLRCLAM